MVLCVFLVLRWFGGFFVCVFVVFFCVGEVVFVDWFFVFFLFLRWFGGFFVCVFVFVFLVGEVVFVGLVLCVFFSF